MKGKFWRKALAAALALLIVSGSTPIQPLSQVFEDIAITANAETNTSTITVDSTDYTLFTGFTATDGTAVGNAFVYGNMVDGDLSSSFHVFTSPAYVEFNSDVPIIPNGYIFNTYNASSFKPTGWVLKAKANTADEWTTLSSKSGSLASGQEFQYACDNSENNAYKYFRFEVSNSSDNIWLTEIRLYGSSPEVYYTHLTVRDATCTETGIKQDCYQRNDGKYFTDETGATELAESDVIAPIIAHNGIHHEATDVNIEYWECSMCHKLFSDEDCTTEITEEQTKIYHTITIDNSISGLVRNDFSETQALAGETVYLYISDLIDASTLKVNNGAVELTAVTDIQYTFTMPAADVTVTADVAQSNADGDVLTGSIRHTVTIPDGASITLNNATITGSIVCEGSATITLVGTNSVSGATNKAGIQIGSSGTTLTIRGDGSLTTNGGSQSAGIGLSRIWNYDSNVSSGDIVIEGGTITATGGNWGAGIGTGAIKNTNNDNSTSVQFGNVTIKGGTVTATGGDSGDGIGKGYSYPGPAITFGTVTIYDGIDKVDASSIKNSGSIVYKHEENDVTASTSDYFTIIENGNRRIIVQKVTPTIADVPDQTYTGSAITPEPLVQTGSLSLTKGTDYEYSYTNNTNVGTAKVTVTFKGDYASLGSVEKEFNIVRATPTVTAPTANTLTYNGNEQELVTAGSTDFGTVLYSLDGTNYSENIPKATDAGTYTIYYKVDTDNYFYAPQTVEVTIAESYTITWKNGDEIVETDNYVPGGATPVYNGNAPTKGTTAQYTYTFSGWSDGTNTYAPNALPTVSGDATYTAQFDSTVNKYTVTWKNGDTVLETDSDVPYGTTPTYDGETPTKTADAMYTYSFAGWSPNVSAVSENAEYTATFTSTPKTYNVTYKVDGVIYGDVDTVAYGTALTARDVPARDGYIFSGWSEIPETMPDHDIEITGTFAINTYAVNFVDADGVTALADAQTVGWNEKASAPDTPTKDGFVFLYWTADGTTEYDFETAVTDNLTLQAVWKEAVNATVQLDVSSGIVGGKNSLIYVSYAGDLSEGCTVTSVGFYVATNKFLGFTDDNTTNVMDLDGYDVKEIMKNNTTGLVKEYVKAESTHELQLRVGANTSYYFYVLPYVVVTDESGNEYVFYGDVSAATFDSVQ